MYGDDEKTVINGWDIEIYLWNGYFCCFIEL